MSVNLNKFRVSAAAIGVVALLGAIPAHAADVIMEEPAPPAMPLEEAPLNTWSGPYAGVVLGYGFNGRTRAPGNTVNTDGFIGGGFAGWNYQDGMFVAGIEADAGYAGLRGSNAGLTSRSSFDSSLRARIGIAVTDDILIYGTGGGALQNLRVSNAAGSDSNTMLGYTVGAGVDAKITERVFGRVEYRYTDFGSKSFSPGGGAAQRVDTTDNRVMFGIGMKF
jgi:outer membrane immunogenic protein